MDATKQVPLEIEDLNEAQLKELEKNHKALRLLTGGLGDSDKRKFLSSLTAKEKWDALEKIHAGSEDVKQDRISALTQDYNNLRMHEKETIEEFQTRFMSLVNFLTYLGEEIPSWKQVTRVLQCLNKSWEPIALHFQTQPHTKKFDIDEFFGKLSAFKGLQKKKEEC